MLKVMLVEDTSVPIVFVSDELRTVDICLCFTQEQIESVRNNPHLREDTEFPNE
jgi:hypothetical protein